MNRFFYSFTRFRLWSLILIVSLAMSTSCVGDEGDEPDFPCEEYPTDDPSQNPDDDDTQTPGEGEGENPGTGEGEGDTPGTGEGDDNPVTPPEPDFDAAAINLQRMIVIWSDPEVTEGDNVKVDIREVTFTSPLEGVALSSVQMVRDGEVLASGPYTPGMTLSTRVRNWPQGTNKVALRGIFKYSDKELTLPLTDNDVFVFRTRPQFSIAGKLNVSKDIHWVATNGQSFRQSVNFDVEGETELSFKSNVTWLASNGEKFTLTDLNLTLTPLLKESNFNATMTVNAIHWDTPDGPLGATRTLTLPIDTKVYADVTVTGTHEGVTITRTETHTYHIVGYNE